MPQNIRSYHLRGALIFLCGTVFGAPMASASPILWNLVGVTLTDGGTASGSFRYDAAINLYSAVSITTAGGSVAGATYLALAPVFGPTDLILAVVPNASLANFTGTRELGFGFDSPLTASGGTVPITAFFSAEATCDNAICNSATSFREVTAGSVSSAVPEPSSLCLILLGTLGLVIRRAANSARMLSK